MVTDIFASTKRGEQRLQWTIIIIEIDRMKGS